MKFDTRVHLGPVELRAGDDEKRPTISGTAAVYGLESENLGWFTEVFAAGAFRDSINAGDDIRCLFDHDTAKILGRRSAGTFTIMEDDSAVKVSAMLPDTTYAADVRELIGRGDVSGMSVGFWVEYGDDEWEEGDDGMWKRTVHKAKLVESSVTGFPAYPQTDVATRSLDRWKKDNVTPWEAENRTRERRMRLALA